MKTDHRLHRNTSSAASAWVLTAVMSVPLVSDQACWKLSSSRCLRGLGIWWKRMNSRTLIIWAW
ncbi:hypothetical protein EYF80_023795 [Liparis tanakae]|uniref:Uncharacterized protein n=1 Tax=Liparis tanakae TaxID=230148 RepID=A0A4Z2HJE9_9TELE|nr:hypothetical protein EYF80_023795 [Liparis tanakae]